MAASFFLLSIFISMSKSGIKVSAPATVTNIAGGMTTLGVALESPADEIIIKEGNQSGLIIHEIQGAAKRLSTDIYMNPAGMAAQLLLEHLGESQRPLTLDIHKKISLDAGLGSSAALAAAGVFAVNEYLRTGLSKHDILPFAVKALQNNNVDDGLAHVIPSLMGGMALVTDELLPGFKKMYIPAGFYIVVIYPETPLSNQAWIKDVISTQVPFYESMDHARNLAAFVASMYTSDMGLMSSALQQVTEQENIAAQIPEYYEMKEKALMAGASGFGIAGFGPSMYAVCTDSGTAKNIIDEAKILYKIKKYGTSIYLSKVNHEGAIAY